jgi:hypothetical protein
LERNQLLVRLRKPNPPRTAVKPSNPHTQVLAAMACPSWARRSVSLRPVGKGVAIYAFSQLDTEGTSLLLGGSNR